MATNTPHPTPVGTSQIEVADDTQIQGYQGIATEFFRGVLALDYGACLVTDESQLSDFSSCGMPDAGTENASLPELYDAWDTWIISEISRRYGVDLSSTRVSLVRLFELIRQASGAPVQH